MTRFLFKLIICALLATAASLVYLSIEVGRSRSTRFTNGSARRGSSSMTR